jgi:glutamate/tyrosine decarboxylase-like PLP-dependent enzyme
MTDDALARAHELAAEWLDTLRERPVDAAGEPAGLGGPLPERGEEPAAVVEALAAAAEPGLVASAGPRYFGFVTGGALPAALAADWLTSAWDQNAGLYSMSPAAAAAEATVLAWCRELLGLPEGAGGGLTTGAQMANVTALAAARHAVLARAGWDVEAHGLAGAPPLRVIVSDESHATVFNALRLLGLGRDTPIRVATDAQGRMRIDALRDALAAAAAAGGSASVSGDPAADSAAGGSASAAGDPAAASAAGGSASAAGHPAAAPPTIVCAQAGNVNTGAFDPLEEIAAACREHGAWLHIDGAFGLWAAAAPERARLAAGAAAADSWAVDAHKWLNVPYDCALAFVADPAPLNAAMSLTAAYLTAAGERERNGADWSPEASRRARAFPLYAALRQLGRAGMAELVEGHCRLAARMAERLRAEPGVTILNDVVLNQVLVRFGDDDAATEAVIARVQEDGTCWLGGTRWHGVAAMRISVSGWQTTEADADRSADAIAAAWRGTV